MKLNKQSIKNILIIILGNLSLAFSTSIFILPHNIVNGGTSGLGVVLKGFFGISPELVITIAIWLLFFVGLIVLGKEFAIKTLLSTVLYPVFINAFSNISIFSDLASQVSNSLLAALAGAVLAGFGLGIVYVVGASTGGFDVICLMLKKYFNVKLSLSTLIIDSTIIILGLVGVSFENALYGLLCAVLMSYVIERITINGTRSYMAHIVSDKLEEINDYLLNVLERGTTLIKVEGGHTRTEKMMIEIVFNEKEYYEIKRNIHLIDSNAFMSVYKSINAYGNGFEKVIIRRK